MSAQDYLIDHAGFDWPNLLAGWGALLPEKFTVWLVNRFGDLFLLLPDGSVHLLDVAAGTSTRLADSQDDFFRKIDEDDNAAKWLLLSLVDRLVASGVGLGPGTCYSFRVPPPLGGQRDAANTEVVSIVEHYRRYGLTHLRLRGLAR